MAKPKPKPKVERVMGEYKRGTLHSGAPQGPKVTDRKQALAIALSEARKAGGKVPPPPRTPAKGTRPARPPR